MAVCRECLDRKPGCHDKCERYQAERIANNERKDMIKKAKEAQVNLTSYEIETKRKYKRSHGKK